MDWLLADRDNPLNRQNVIKCLKEHVVLAQRKIRDGFGGRENSALNGAQNLLARKFQPGVRRADGMGLDEAAVEMAA